MGADLAIGKLADAAGVNVETIRYYRRRGLLTLAVVFSMPLIVANAGGRPGPERCAWAVRRR